MVTLLNFFSSGCGMAWQRGNESEDKGRTLRILATSDIHGKFYPYLYARNKEDTSGSLAQLATAIPEFRTENTILVDCGDSIQDNSADIFIGEDVHPVIEGLNKLGYDIWVPGNHDFDYGMDVTKKTIASFDGYVLSGNVYDENNIPLADGYIILNRGGVRIALIGMVTPYIQFWGAKNLENCTVLDPVEQTRRIIDKIQGRYDVLVGTMHMDVVNDNGYPHSGVKEIAEACPEFDVILASHGHKLIEDERINNVPVVENKKHGKTMAVIDLSLDKAEGGWTVSGVRSGSVDISEYDPDPEFLEDFESYHEAAIEDSLRVIGSFEDDALVDENELDFVPAILTKDSALVDLLNTVFLFYSEGDVSATGVSGPESNLYRGDIKKCDISFIYGYSDTIYTFKMTGRQLKTVLEWSASYYNQYQPGDLTISFDGESKYYNYYMFSGINYDIDISKEKGNRIQNLTWPEGTPVEDGDSFVFAVDSHFASSKLMASDSVFGDGDAPELIMTDVRSDIGSIPDMLREYIVKECGGVLKKECDNNWKIVGNNWDEALHRQAVELVKEGKITVPCTDDFHRLATGPVREQDLNSVFDR